MKTFDGLCTQCGGVIRVTIRYVASLRRHMYFKRRDNTRFAASVKSP